MVWQGCLLGLFTLGVYAWRSPHTPAEPGLGLRTLAFTQLAHSFNVRSTHASLFQIGWFSNRPLLLAVLASAALQVAVLAIPFLAPFFDVVPLTGWDLELLLLAVVTPWGGGRAAQGRIPPARGRKGRVTGRSRHHPGSRPGRA